MRFSHDRFAVDILASSTTNFWPSAADDDSTTGVDPLQTSPLAGFGKALRA